MFEDIIGKKWYDEETPEPNIKLGCTHIGRQHHCQYFEPTREVPYLLPICDFFDKKTNICKLEKFA